MKLWEGWMRLHWVTWGLIALAVIEAGIAVFFGWQTLERARLGAMYGSEGWGFGLQSLLRDMLYGLTWLGTAAMYEMLYRIWRTLAARKPGPEPTD